MTRKPLFLFLLAAWLWPGDAAGAAFIVAGGQPRAEIVTAPAPPRMVKLAAEELQAYLEKISGARLPVVTGPGTELPVKIYVGRSAHTDRLGVSEAGLDDGAFRMVSGSDWLVLLGGDGDFTPREPWARNNGQIPAMLAEWDKLTGAAWDNPVGGPLYRQYNRAMDLWAYDERGSLNAVYEFLRRLGVRWYLPGELGEVVPSTADIPLPAADETVRPAFGLRMMTPLSTTYASLQPDDMFWQLRLGLNAHSRALGVVPHLSHGLASVLSRPEMRAAHPEYYALVNGRRDTTRNHACLSNDGLVAEAARFARAMFEICGAATVSMMPEDGFTFCQCEACAGRDTPERGRVGTYSDYVWSFVDRVAREVSKTHAERTINCFAYGTYTLPPEKIEKLSPNVQVGIVHGRGWYFPDPTERGLDLSLVDLRRAWLAKTDRPMIGYEHYPFTYRGTFLPIYFPRVIAAGLKAQRDNTLGEKIEVSWGPHEVRGHGLHSPEFNHLNVYLTARLYWDPEQDAEAMLAEYFQLFYGPAGDGVAAFTRHCEENWKQMSADGALVARALELFAAARAQAEPGSVYDRRLAQLAEYLVPFGQLGAQLARGRENVPEAREPVVAAADITVDGRLDEPAWGPYLAQYRGQGLRDLKTGEQPKARTSFHLRWAGGPPGGALYLGIICEEPDAAGLATAGPDGDPVLPGGDLVELLLETQAHSYYHLVMNPVGALAEFDRQGGKVNLDWKSRAEVAAHVGDGFWSVELRLPVPGRDQLGDPLDEVAGRRPNADFPWFINIGRQRVRGGAVERFAWSPTGGDSIHEPMKFGKFFVR